MTRHLSALVAAGLLCTSPASAAPHWAGVDRIFGRVGTEQPGHVRRYGFSRFDLAVTLDGAPISPALALGSWLAFRESGDQAMVMGDLVLTHEEVNPVLSKLLEGGLTISALHNHLLRSQPATMYMHIHGHGDPVALAQTIRDALALSKTPFGPPPVVLATTPPLDTAALDRIIGAKGKSNGDVYQFSLPRAEQVVDNGTPVPPAMGLGTTLNFQPTGRGKAAVTGDFVLTQSEVTPVLKALRGNGIEVTALHNHLTDEQPRLFFMHFWANADAERLAAGLRQALDRMNLKR